MFWFRIFSRINLICFPNLSLRYHTIRIVDYWKLELCNNFIYWSLGEDLEYKQHLWTGSCDWQAWASNWPHKVWKKIINSTLKNHIQMDFRHLYCSSDKRTMSTGSMYQILMPQARQSDQTSWVERKRVAHFPFCDRILVTWFLFMLFVASCGIF